MGWNRSRINNRWFRNGYVLTSWYLQINRWKLRSIKFKYSICSWLLYKMDIFISIWYWKNNKKCILTSKLWIDLNCIISFRKV
jgi:hypothetical protein